MLQHREQFNKSRALRVQFPQREFEMGAGEEGAGFAPPLRDAATDCFALGRIPSMLQPVAVAGWRSHPWVPHVLWTQHLER